MCFSATASYTTAAALTLIGCACVNKTTQPRHLLLAFIPILFAFQQLMEGILWTSTNQIEDFVRYAPMLKNAYLTVAFFIWPIWIPLSVWAIESTNWRNWVLAGLLLLGCATVAWFGYEMIYIHRWEGTDVRVDDHSIHYVFPMEFGLLYAATYCAVTVLPPFFSSWRYMWVIGLLNFIGLFTAWYLYETTFVSVWCFFAAIVSIAIYFVMKLNLAKPQVTS